MYWFAYLIAGIGDFKCANLADKRSSTMPIMRMSITLLTCGVAAALIREPDAGMCEAVQCGAGCGCARLRNLMPRTVSITPTTIAIAPI